VLHLLGEEGFELLQVEVHPDAAVELGFLAARARRLDLASAFS
jgi:hypothetical protein